MALDLEEAVVVALPSEVGEWAQSIAGATLSARATRVAQIESNSGVEKELQPHGANDSGEMRTLAANESDAKPKRGRRGLTIAIALALASLVGLAFLFRPPSGPPHAAASSATQTTPAPPRPSDQVPSAAPAAEPSPSAAFEEPATPDVAPSASAASPPSAAPRVTKHPQPKCDPPYRIDASGHKIFKVECI